MAHGPKVSQDSVCQGLLWKDFNLLDDKGINVGYCNLRLFLEKLEEVQKNPLLCPSIKNLLNHPRYDNNNEHATTPFVIAYSKG